MILDTSNSAWNVLVAQAKRKKAENESWISPKQGRSYVIKDVLEDKIIIQRERGRNSVLGKKFLTQRLNEINQFSGRLHRKQFKGHVAKMAAIVFLHHELSWSNDHNWIIVSKDQINASDSTYYKDYGDPPNDDIDELQHFAEESVRGKKDSEMLC